MAMFKRRGPDGQDDRSTTGGNQPSAQYSSGAPQNQGSGTDPQYQGGGSGQQYQDPQYQGGGTGQQQYQDPQYQRGGTGQQYQDPQYQGAGTGQQQYQDPQYQRGGRDTQYQRGGAGYAAGYERPHGLPGGWIGELLLGLGTLVIGLIVAFHPIHTLNALAILIGVLMIISGVYHVIRSLRRTGDHRMWGGIAGVLFFLVGIFLIRHVGLTLALIALFAGFAFVIAGIAMLAEAVTGRGPLGRFWSALFGIILVFAGIASIVTPIHSLARLAIVLGWAFVAFGIMHIIGAFTGRRDMRAEEARSEQVAIPGQRVSDRREREDTYTDQEGAYGGQTTTQTGASRGEPRHRRL